MKINWFSRILCATLVIFSGLAFGDAEPMRLMAANDIAAFRCANTVTKLNTPIELPVSLKSPNPEKVVLLAAASTGNEKRGIVAFSFDDGYPNWLRIAQILKKYDGFATGYVNNWKLDSGDITAELLRTLQDAYGWEIGTHTYAHANPEPFALLYGKDKWVQDELVRSISQFSQMGLRIRSLVFPYNKANSELRRAALEHVSSFRAADEKPVGTGIRQDGSFSGKALDVGNYVPLEVVRKWIDQVHREGNVLLIYGHQLLPDSKFRTGTVQSVNSRELMAKEPVEHLTDPYICLVPDMSRSLLGGISISKIEGSQIVVSNGNISTITEPGARFLIGPCMGLRESDFEAIVSYASPRLEFRRISDLPRLR